MKADLFFNFSCSHLLNFAGTVLCFWKLKNFISLKILWPNLSNNLEWTFDQARFAWFDYRLKKRERENQRSKFPGFALSLSYVEEF